jgi:thioredoxin-like negative regulator of GroEL
MNRNDDFDLDLQDDDFLKKYTEKLFEKSLFTEFTNEETLIDLSLHQSLIVNFLSKNFSKCLKMNESLKKIAKNYKNIKFGFINVDNCPKMCQALKIKVLPFVGFFKDGYFVDHLVGFEKVGNGDQLKIDDLERYINNSEICKK